MNGALPDVWHWLNSNILVSSEFIFTLQKSSFSHAFLYDSNLLFCPKRMKTIQTIKITSMLSLLIMPMNFLLQDNTIVFLPLKSWKEQLVFHGFSYVLKHKKDTFFPF